MKLSELKQLLDELYGFDIAKHTRKREYAYARKVFVQLARNYGYRVKDVCKEIDQKHDLVIYHYNTFHTIKPMDLEKYNVCIDYYNLNMEKIPSMSWYINGKRVQSIIDKLKSLGNKDLAYFEKNNLNDFMKAIEREKELQNLCSNG